MDLVAKRFVNVQMRMFYNAAHRLKAWALKHGDEDQQRLASFIADVATRIEPKFTYEVEDRSPRKKYVEYSSRGKRVLTPRTNPPE